MTIAAITPNATSSASDSSRSERAERTGEGVGAAAAHVAEAVVDGVSATVSFSGKALHALEEAGEFVLGGAQDLAVGAWHGLEQAAHTAEHVGEAVVDAVETGAHEIAETAVTAGKQLAHYAAVGAHATGEVVSDVASGTVMAASAAGKTIMALV